MKIKELAGLAAIVVGTFVSSGCNSVVYDWHVKTGEPVRGVVPLALSGFEKHHGYEQTDRVALIDYPLR